jgi:protein-disulfide isomerase
LAECRPADRAGDGESVRSEKLTTALLVGLLALQTVLLGVLLRRINTLERTVLTAVAGAGAGSGETDEVVAVDPGPGPLLGAAGAPVTIVEFSCFTCPACADLEPELKQTLARHPGQVRLAYRYFPLQLKGKPMMLAKAAECAGRRGKFWEAHDLLFSKSDQIEQEADLLEAAASLGLDREELAQCLASAEVEARVRADFEAGRSYGVTGTPTLFVNGKRVRGADSRTIDRLVESSLGST